MSTVPSRLASPGNVAIIVTALEPLSDQPKVKPSASAVELKMGPNRRQTEGVALLQVRLDLGCGRVPAE